MYRKENICIEIEMKRRKKNNFYHHQHLHHHRIAREINYLLEMMKGEKKN